MTEIKAGRIRSQSGPALYSPALYSELCQSLSRPLSGQAFSRPPRTTQ